MDWLYPDYTHAIASSKPVNNPLGLVPVLVRAVRHYCWYKKERNMTFAVMSNY
jgi:hypothetical protein